MTNRRRRATVTLHVPATTAATLSDSTQTLLNRTLENLAVDDVPGTSGERRRGSAPEQQCINGHADYRSYSNTRNDETVQQGKQTNNAGTANGRLRKSCLMM